MTGPSFTPGEAVQLVCCVDPQNVCKAAGCMAWRWAVPRKIRSAAPDSGEAETVIVAGEVGFCGRAGWVE